LLRSQLQATFKAWSRDDYLTATREYVRQVRPRGGGGGSARPTAVPQGAAPSLLAQPPSPGALASHASLLASSHAALPLTPGPSYHPPCLGCQYALYLAHADDPPTLARLEAAVAAHRRQEACILLMAVDLLFACQVRGRTGGRPRGGRGQVAAGGGRRGGEGGEARLPVPAPRAQPSKAGACPSSTS
jgi:hypothetical protein